MRRFLSVLLVVILAIGNLFSLSQRLSAETKVLTDADNAGEIHLKVGDCLELHLKSNPTTGFAWYLQKQSTPLMKLVKQGETPPDTPMPGSGKFQIFYFEARQAGDGNLLLHYVRSWEPPSPDETHFTVHVIIQ